MTTIPKRRTFGRVDAAMMDRGYCERLTGRGGWNIELQELPTQEHGRDGAHQAQASVRNRDAYLHIEFIPKSTATVANVNFRIKSWGMCNRDNTLEKPPGLFGIALVGASRAMEWDVQYHELGTILENRLNRETRRRGPALRNPQFQRLRSRRYKTPMHPDRPDELC